MRFPLATQLKTRPGDLEKDARLTNSYAEIKGDTATVRKRSGSTDLGIINAGISQVLVCWNKLLSVIADSLKSTVITGGVATPSDIASLNPKTPNLPLSSQSSGAAQTQQQLLIKSSEQAWIYTPE